MPHVHVHLELVEDHGDHISRHPVESDQFDIQLIVDWRLVARGVIRAP